MFDIPQDELGGGLFADVLDPFTPGVATPFAVPEPSGEGAIELTGDDLKRFTFRFDYSLSNAMTRMEKIHRDARIDRAVYKMMEKPQDYPGQPNITSPLSANKADGVLAHIIDAAEQRPLYSFTPEGIGKPAEVASQVASVCEAYLEREINRTHSRERLIREIPKEAVQVGTGIAKLAMAQYPNGEWFAQADRIIKLEHFYVDRINVPNLKHTFCAFEFRERFYVLEEWAEQGYIDAVALEEIKAAHSANFTRTIEEEEAEFDEWNFAMQQENAVYKLYEGYMRFRPTGQSKSEIFQCIWSSEYKKPLAIRRNPVRDAFDAPPIKLVRIGKQSNNLFGRGIMRRLNAEQRMADNGINNHLAMNNLAASPPFLYRMHSPFGKALDGKKTLRPGQGIATLSAPGDGDVKILEFPNNGLNFQDVEIAQSFADKATYTEEAIGTSAGRKTLGQFRVEVQRGSMRLKLDVGDFAYDMADLGTMLWAMMNAYKVSADGVVEVEQGGKLLGARDIPTYEVSEVIDGILVGMVESEQMSDEEVQEFMASFPDRLTAGRIPSARRSDLTISLTGTKVIADKAAELDMLFQLTPYITALFEGAKRDSYLNYHLRSIIEAMGFKDVEKRIPKDPGMVVENPIERQMLTQPFNEIMNQSAQMV